MGEPPNEQEMNTTVKEPEKTAPSLLVEAARRVVDRRTPLIIDKTIAAPSGDKRDFVSISPNHFQAEDGGLVVRDGETNPLTQKYPDNKNLGKAVGDIITTSLAAKETTDSVEKDIFASRAISVINSWFVDEETRMTPTLEFAHMRPGETVGGFWGIICGARLIRAMDGINLLKEGNLINAEILSGIESWFNQYLNWLLTSEKAIGDPAAEGGPPRAGERGMPNNHGTFYDLQVAYIADFLNKPDLVRKTIEGAKDRINSQINPDGEMPLETARATPYDYQLFNLYGFTELALLGKKYDIDLWNYETEDGRGLKKAFGYFAGQLENAGDMPFKEDKSGELYFAFRAASKAYNNSNYWDLPKKYYPDPLTDEVTQEMFR